MIRFWQSFLYGCLELPLTGIEVLLRLYLVIHFTESVGLSLGTCLVALLLSLFWGTLFEPWIGHRSDQFIQGGQSRWPWVLTGCLFTGGILLFLFSVPPTWAPTAKMFALLGGLILLNSAWAVAAVPYSALVGEVRGGDVQQSFFIGWRTAFGHLGALMSIGIAGFYTRQAASPDLHSLAWILVIILYFLGFLASLRRPGFHPDEKSAEEVYNAAPVPHMGAWQPLVATLSAGFFFQVVGAAHSGLALLSFKHALGLSETDAQNLLLLFWGANLAFIPIWLWAAHRFQSLNALLFGLGLFVVLQTASLQLNSAPALLPAWSIFTGASFSCGVLFEKILTQMGRPPWGPGQGLTFGLWRISGKISRFTAVILSSFALSWAGIEGFDPRIVDRSAWLFGPSLAGVILASVLLLAIFRRSRAVKK